MEPSHLRLAISAYCIGPMLGPVAGPIIVSCPTGMKISLREAKLTFTHLGWLHLRAMGMESA